MYPLIAWFDVKTPKFSPIGLKSNKYEYFTHLKLWVAVARRNFQVGKYVSFII